MTTDDHLLWRVRRCFAFAKQRHEPLSYFAVRNNIPLPSSISDQISSVFRARRAQRASSVYSLILYVKTDPGAIQPPSCFIFFLFFGSITHTHTHTHTGIICFLCSYVCSSTRDLNSYTHPTRLPNLSR